MEASLRFTRPSIRGQQTLLVELHVQRTPGAEVGDAELRDRIAALVRRTVASQEPTVTPSTAVTVLAP